MDAVRSTDSSAPLGSRAAEIYAKFAADHADKDFSAIIEMLRKQLGNRFVRALMSPHELWSVPAAKARRGLSEFLLRGAGS